ncbi:MAG: hypothetical protein KKF68_02490 [Nanoarchaeota archaeon]|nr:hypothetical protein [Nanoarchaeota archaeon]
MPLLKSVRYVIGGWIGKTSEGVEIALSEGPFTAPCYVVFVDVDGKLVDRGN